MAVKKSTKSGGASEATTAAKKPAVKKKAEASVASETSAKSATPKAAKKAAAAAPAPAPKAAAPAKKAGEIKLNDRQREFLKKIKDAGEPGYLIGQKIEQRTIDALVDRKLLKKGPKHKESGSFHYVLTKAGEKHLTAAPAPQA